MPLINITLRVLLPYRIFLEQGDVIRVVAETRHGSFGILPRRLDCVAALEPGILTYQTEAEGAQYLAVDEGILVKAGLDVLVSVRNAMGGAGLGELRESVDREFLRIDEDEKRMRLTLAKLESDFVRRFRELRYE